MSKWLAVTPRKPMSIDAVSQQIAVAIYHPTAEVYDHEAYYGAKQIGGSNDVWLYPGPWHGFPQGVYVLQTRYDMPKDWYDAIQTLFQIEVMP